MARVPAACDFNGLTEHQAHDVEAASEANARLIAAAPDLLELLKLALGDGPDCDCVAGQHSCGWPKWQQRAKDVIAKAEART